MSGKDRIEAVLEQRIRAKAACDSGAGFDYELREYSRLAKLADAIASDLDTLARIREAAGPVRKALASSDALSASFGGFAGEHDTCFHKLLRAIDGETE